jgi:hypothetical protein
MGHPRMAESSPSLELLCELSELERLLAARPDAQGYRKLSLGYAQAGWPKEAARAELKAKALASGAVVVPTPVQSLTGACNPGVLVEILRALHETGKNGPAGIDRPRRRPCVPRADWGASGGCPILRRHRRGTLAVPGRVPAGGALRFPARAAACGATLAADTHP